jgi:hypothetical protein
MPLANIAIIKPDNKNNIKKSDDFHKDKFSLFLKKSEGFLLENFLSIIKLNQSPIHESVTAIDGRSSSTSVSNFEIIGRIFAVVRYVMPICL